ncbi:MAG: HAMP domain-containing protein [Oscillospiraceae bacterium]|nr:HAMP domain-containing protein [Oscillospiraceae bacterium]
MKKAGGLRKRWLINTIGVVFALGLACVAAITFSFAVYYYNGMESDMSYRAKTTVDYFTNHINHNYNEYYQSCINYANTFEGKNQIELQFIDANGKLVATSFGGWAEQVSLTTDIQEAVTLREHRSYIGKDPITGERIIAVSCPMIYSNGEVIGVLRYVTSTRLLDKQITMVAVYALCALLVVMVILLLSNGYYIRSILIPVAEITEKAKRIAGGSYGIQIQTHYNDEIGDLANTINEMSVQINQNDAMQREFISSLSHELRTPLTAITGWSETLLADENLDPETQRGMNIILRESRRLTGMVVDLLDFTRLQDDRMTLNIRQTDIRGEFEDTVFMYSSRLSQEEMELVYIENDQEIPEIPCDPERLRQVFLNILDNAAKHGKDGKRIDASLVHENNKIIIRIRDYGPGISEDELPLVKKKFYKGSSKARGSGIGLAVCDEIVLRHNGTLTLENAEGGGTLVTVELPDMQ